MERYYVYRLMEVINMSRTNVVLDDKLVESCQKATGIKTKKSLIDFALHEVLRHENQKKLLELKGNVDWQGDLSSWRKGSLA
jgi:Arc/MetJ family transcription regulator